MIKVTSFEKPGPCSTCKTKLPAFNRWKICFSTVHPIYLCEVCTRSLFLQLKEALK